MAGHGALAMKIALFDQDGAPVAFFITEFHGPLLDKAGARNPQYPPGAIEISDKDWRELTSNPGTRLWRDGKVVPTPTSPPAGPRVITRQQFFTQLALDGIISEDEAEQTSSGSLPMLLQEALAAIPDPSEAFKARMLVRNAATFERAHPLVAVLASHPRLRWDAARLDKLWLDASKL